MPGIGSNRRLSVFASFKKESSYGHEYIGLYIIDTHNNTHYFLFVNHKSKTRKAFLAHIIVIITLFIFTDLRVKYP